MDNELFGKMHEQKENAFYDKQHERELLSLSNLVENTELVACDEQGTPIIGKYGEKICNCAEPWQSLFPNNKYYCLHCLGEWYH